MHGGLRNDAAGAVAEQNLDRYAGIVLPVIFQIDERAGDTVGELIRVHWVYFFKHFFYPFLARSSLSMRSSCGETSP